MPTNAVSCWPLKMYKVCVLVGFCSQCIHVVRLPNLIELMHFLCFFSVFQYCLCCLLLEHCSKCYHFFVFCGILFHSNVWLAWSQYCYSQANKKILKVMPQSKNIVEDSRVASWIVDKKQHTSVQSTPKA